MSNSTVFDIRRDELEPIDSQMTASSSTVLNAAARVTSYMHKFDRAMSTPSKRWADGRTKRRVSSSVGPSLRLSVCVFYGVWRWRSCSVRSSTDLTSEIVRRSSWWSWSINVWTAGHLSTSPFTVSHCSARDISVPLSEIYGTYHVTDSTRTAARLLPLLVCPRGTVFRTLSAIRTPPKLLLGAYKDILFAQYSRTERIRGICLSVSYINRHINIDVDIGRNANDNASDMRATTGPEATVVDVH